MTRTRETSRHTRERQVPDAELPQRHDGRRRQAPGYTDNYDEEVDIRFAIEDEEDVFDLIADGTFELDSPSFPHRPGGRFFT